MKLIDKKMSKEEVQMKIEYVDQKVSRLEKVVKNCDAKVGSYDVSHFFRIFIQLVTCWKSCVGSQKCWD